MKTLFLCALLTLLPGGPPFQDVSRDALALHGLQMAENLLQKPDYWLYEEPQKTAGVHYAEVFTAVGALKLAHQLGDTATVRRLIDRYSGYLDEGSPLISRRQHVDHNVMGVLPLEIYLINHDRRYLAQGLTFADRQWAETTGDGLTAQTRWWIDDMYMIGVLQMTAYRASGKKKYADRAGRQLAAYVTRLQRPNGLFYHEPEVPFFWGRGNGWVAASLAVLVRDLPADNPDYALLLAGYRKMMAALLQYQSDNGLWRQLIDDPYAWTETSGTAMFAYAMAVGVKRGLLDEATYGPAVVRAWRALDAHVNPAGNLREVCVGTNKKNDREFYYERPRVTGDMHGHAPYLWLAAELAEVR